MKRWQTENYKTWRKQYDKNNHDKITTARKAYWDRPENRIRLRAHNKKYRDQRRGFIKEYLTSHPCIDCGNADTRVLEFDHIVGTKLGNVVASGFSMPGLVSEIAKCVIRCANCHKIRHYEQRIA